MRHDPPPTREWRRTDAWGVTRQIALLRDLTAAPGVIAADLITDLGVRDLSEAMRVLAGSPNDPTDPDQMAWLVRGFAPSSIAPAIADGARRASAFGPVDPVSVDHLELVHGVLDPVYGAVGSPGGALHRVGRMPRLEPMRALTLGGDGEGRVRGTVDVSDGFGRSRATWRVSAAGDRLRDARTGDDPGHGFAVAPVVAWPLNDFTTLTLRADHAQRERRDDPGLPLTAAGLTVPRDAWYGARRAAPVRTAASDATLEFTYDPEGEVRLRQRLAFDRSTRRGAATQLMGTTSEGFVVRGLRDLDRRTQGFDAQSEAVLAFLTGGRQHQGVVGVEFAGARTERDASPALLDLVPLTGTPATDVATGRTAGSAWRGEDRTLAVYANDQVMLGTRWRASFGVRVARDEHRLTSSPDAPVTTTRVVGVSPRAGLAYLTSASTRLHVAWSAGTRANERCTACGDAPAPSAAHDRQFEAGWRQDLRNGRFGWSATVYDLEDRDAVLRSGDPERAARLVPRRTSRGAELLASGEVATDLRLMLSATWTEARVADAGTSGLASDARLPRVPTRALTATAIRRVSAGAFTGLDVGVGLAVESARPADALGTLTLPGATLVSAMLGYGRDRWHVQLNATNLTDARAYDASESGALWPRAPRAVHGTLRWTF